MNISKNYFNKSLLLIIPTVAIILVSIFLLSYGIKDLSESVKYVIHSILITTGLWIGCTLIVGFLWKKFPWETSPVKHLVLEVILILAYIVVFCFPLYFLEKKFFNLAESKNLVLEIFATILITFFITAIYESVFFYQQWKYNFSRSVRLEKDNLEAKYEALRAQINPHFLFNSLNGLTTLVEENKEAVDYVQNLSVLLRYMMKSGERELVFLAEELDITLNYISLQKKRFSGSLNVKISVSEKCGNLMVPPLVIQMLVENCIKHNIISRENPLNIEIRAEDDSLTVINNLQPKSGVTSTGHGLSNIMDRYGFFTERKVEVQNNGNTFSVSIPLLKTEK